MFGNWGRLLHVDLSKKNISIKKRQEAFYKKYLGGVGLASKLFFEHLGANIFPLRPENLIVFAVGPYQGSRVPGSGRWIVAAQSPLTNIWADSCGGGYWGPEFKNSGFDAVTVTGRSKVPVYLWIHDGNVEIRDAKDVWGATTSKADKIIKEDLSEPKARVVLIGPAGERLVKFACIVSDHGYAGRCGIGAVMGAKNLKAIAVRGVQTVKVAKTDALQVYQRTLSQKIHAATKSFRKYGTTDFAKLLHDSRGYGLARNWREGKFRYINDLAGDRFLEFVVQPIACSDCPIACHRYSQVKQPREYAFKGHGPEYETIGMIGWLNQLRDPKAVAYAGHLCNEYGLDTITMGSLIGFTMECFEKGWITKKDLGGVEAKWGSNNASLALIHKTARREGFGNALAEGVQTAAEIVGGDAPNIVVHVKGLDLPAHDPRSFLALAINYATGSRGGCHQRGFVLQDESTIPEWGIPEPAETYSIKKPVVSAARYQDWAELFNSLVQCEYMTAGGLTLTHQIQLLHYITGWNIDAKDMLKLAERIFTMQRLLNLRYGISGRDDTLPSKMFQPLQEGVSVGKTPVNLEQRLQAYYNLRGWDRYGTPTREKLAELELLEEAPENHL